MKLKFHEVKRERGRHRLRLLFLLLSDAAAVISGAGSFAVRGIFSRFRRRIRFRGNFDGRGVFKGNHADADAAQTRSLLP